MYIYHVCVPNLPSPPQMHLAVKKATEVVVKSFYMRYFEEIPLEWKLTVEKEIWKHLYLDQNYEHYKKVHSWRCNGNVEEHARMYGFNALHRLVEKNTIPRFSNFGWRKRWCKL